MSKDLSVTVITISATLAGVIVSQVISVTLSIFDKRHKKHILLREKYEEMFLEFLNSLTYVKEVHNCKTLHQLFELSTPPHVGKAHGLALLYFPNLVEPLSIYMASLASFYESVIFVFDEQDPKNAGGQAMNDKGCQEAISTLLKDRDYVMAALKSNTEKYTKA